MKKVVTTSTPCSCSEGAAGTLVGTGSLKIDNKAVVLETDLAQPLAGVCEKLKNTCAYSPMGLWQNTSKTMSVDKTNVVISSSKLKCINGGEITPLVLNDHVDVKE